VALGRQPPARRAGAGPASPGRQNPGRRVTGGSPSSISNHPRHFLRHARSDYRAGDLLPVRNPGSALIGGLMLVETAPYVPALISKAQIRDRCAGGSQLSGGLTFSAIIMLNNQTARASPLFSVRGQIPLEKLRTVPHSFHSRCSANRIVAGPRPRRSPALGKDRCCHRTANYKGCAATVNTSSAITCWGSTATGQVWVIIPHFSTFEQPIRAKRPRSSKPDPLRAMRGGLY